MNAVEIEEAISVLAEQPFDSGEFPFAFHIAVCLPGEVTKTQATLKASLATGRGRTVRMQ